MQIKVNGEPRQIMPGQSVQALAESLGLNPSQVAIERNREIVSRSCYSDTMLTEGDEVEIVRFIGGG